MSDSRAVPDNDLPWLEEVEDEDGPRGVSAARMLGALLVVVAAAALVAGIFFWLGRQDPVATGGAPELIRAPEGPYKVKPQDPGGLDVAGESETAFETSAGQDVDSQLDTSRLPQAPAPAAEQKPAEVAEPAPPRPAASGASGSVIQLGAYKNTAQAERAWTALTARFPNLSGLSKIVVPYTAGGSSGFRLRAGASSPAQAQQVCRSLEAAGESCFIAR
ncbi:MAG TPA: SPOR domain-containing protein [Sphingomicrobium sp.]|nr:SPOR domain-containing protein [Sphingomicrobium sp.]